MATTTPHERGYIQGQRRVYRELLSTALRGLGAKDAQAQGAAWALERTDACSVLARICDHLGLEFSPDTHMADTLDRIETAIMNL